MSCFTEEQESAVECVHFVVKIGGHREKLEKELRNLYVKQGSTYSTKLTYAYYQHYILAKKFISQELYDACVNEILEIYNELLTGEEEDWFIECLKVMLCEEIYEDFQIIEDYMSLLKKMKELQNQTSDNIPEFIITYILQAFCFYKNNRKEVAAETLKDGLDLCVNGKVRNAIYFQFRGILERFLYQTRCYSEIRLIELIKKIMDIYF